MKLGSKHWFLVEKHLKGYLEPSKVYVLECLHPYLQGLNARIPAEGTQPSANAGSPSQVFLVV